MSRISVGTALHAPLGEFASCLSAAQFRFPVAFDIHPVRTLRFFSGELQDDADGPGCIKRHHGIYTAAQIENALCVMKGAFTEFAARERVTFFVEHIIAALLSPDQSLMR